MTENVARHAQADQTAAELRDRRTSDHGTGVCDAFDPCSDCAAKRRQVRETRAQASVVETEQVAR